MLDSLLTIVRFEFEACYAQRVKGIAGGEEKSIQELFKVLKDEFRNRLASKKKKSRCRCRCRCEGVVRDWAEEETAVQVSFLGGLRLAVPYRDE